MSDNFEEHIVKIQLEAESSPEEIMERLHEYITEVFSPVDGAETENNDYE